MAEREELKSLLMRVKEESEKSSLKLSIKKKKKKFVASGPINSWQIEGEKVDSIISGKSVGKKWKSVTDFLFLALKSLRMLAAAMKLEDHCFLAGKL